jgi:hypothetical protein
MRRFEVAGFRRIVLVGAVLAIGIGGAKLRAQTQLADPRDAPRIFASTCSACHKSPQGLAKSGFVAGFLRQLYTTGPEMSAAMAAYLVAAGSAPAARKGAAETAQKQKAKKQDGSQQGEHAALTPSAADAKDQRTLRGKQRGKQDEPHPAAQPVQQGAAPTVPPAAAPPTVAEPARQTAAAPGETPTASVPAQDAGPPPVVFDIPLPEMPQAPPADLTQSAFTSSPLP